MKRGSMQRQRAITNSIQHQFDQQISFLQRMVQANSANPFTPEGSSATTPIEAEVAAVIHDELHRLGFSASLIGASAQRPNLICHVQGSGKSEKTLILTTHMDTVEPSGYTDHPWSGKREHGRLSGVGSADAKAQIAAFIYAISALWLAGIKPDGNVILAFVVDEEPGACSPFGTQYLLDQGLLSGDAAIIGESLARIKVSIAHRGLYRFRLSIKGEATHTGLKAWEQGRQGRNAILDMVQIAHALSEHPLPQTHSEAFPGRKSVLTFPTLIHGGSGINSVPDLCEAYGDVRLLPGLSADAVKRTIQEHLTALSIENYRLDDLIVVPAAETNAQAEIVRTLATSIEAITGIRPRLEGSGPACDGWMFLTQGIPTVCGYGVTCGGVHGADEWVDLESLRRVTEIYAHTVLSYLSVAI
jgi:succinyl-diaminopimelate desuccinylase